MAYITEPDHTGLAMQKTCLRLYADSEGPDQPAQWRSLFANRIIGYYRDFICVEVLRPRQPNGVMSSAFSLPNHTFTGQDSSKRLTSIVHVLSPEKDTTVKMCEWRAKVLIMLSACAN